MNQTSFGTMLKWIERPFNTTVERDRALLVDTANRIREKMYNLYTQYEIEVDVEECFELQEFCRCGQCDETYRGIALPSYMQTVEAAWASSQPISLYSKWRESKVGITPKEDCRLAMYDMPGLYPTERDLSPCGCIDGLEFLAKSPLDTGKEVVVTYVNEQGDSITERVSLLRSAWASLEYKVKSLRAVILPTHLRGGISIRQQSNERILSEYGPHESVPSYRRVKFTGVPCGCVVVVRASRKYTPLWEDYDIVETANRDAIEDAARHLFYATSGSEGGMIEKSEYHRRMFESSLRGEQSRNIGINRENSTGALGAPVKRSRLISGRRI